VEPFCACVITSLLLLESEAACSRLALVALQARWWIRLGVYTRCSRPALECGLGMRSKSECIGDSAVVGQMDELKMAS
jgi:hypothetical protein